MDSERIELADNPEENRYELRVDGDLGGRLLYRLRPGLVALNHTEIDDRFEGQGLGSRLIAFALDDARARGLAVLPFCPFVNAYVQRHREYVDLVPQVYRRQFDL